MDKKIFNILSFDAIINIINIIALIISFFFSGIDRYYPALIIVSFLILIICFLLIIILPFFIKEKIKGLRVISLLYLVLLQGPSLFLLLLLWVAGSR